jgi:hypothetical protein
MRYKQSGFFEEVTLFINLRLSPLFGQRTDRYLKM